MWEKDGVSLNVNVNVAYLRITCTYIASYLEKKKMNILG
jgi:hypothetical protein